jgi:hypothetical protein
MPDDVKDEYRQAYEGWTKQVTDLHRVLLDGERLDPPQIKGLLNREAHAKERYDAARRKLLGLSD